jgi:hypothetical protein
MLQMTKAGRPLQQGKRTGSRHSAFLAAQGYGASLGGASLLYVLLCLAIYPPAKR